MKPRFSLAPWDALRAIASVYTASAEKHDAGGSVGYQKGRAWSVEFDAAHRHLTEWWLRSPPDKATRLSHLCHAGARIVLLIAYELRGIGTDDRPGKPLAVRSIGAADTSRGSDGEETGK